MRRFMLMVTTGAALALALVLGCSSTGVFESGPPGHEGGGDAGTSSAQGGGGVGGKGDDAGASGCDEHPTIDMIVGNPCGDQAPCASSPTSCVELFCLQPVARCERSLASDGSPCENGGLCSAGQCCH